MKAEEIYKQTAYVPVKHIYEKQTAARIWLKHLV